jgi:hypothetical protein
MAAKIVGVGSQYAAAFVDSEGKPLDGSKTYKIHLPPGIPAKNFWSFVLYDNQTRSELQTDAQFPSIGSQKQGIVINGDSSVDVWFGPTAPPGHEANWVQTVPGKGTARSRRGSTRRGSLVSSRYKSEHTVQCGSETGQNARLKKIDKIILKEVGNTNETLTVAG